MDTAIGVRFGENAAARNVEWLLWHRQSRIPAREHQGLTLADVAERMAIDAPALSRLETGKMLNPTLATLLKCAEALGRKLDAELAAG